VVRKRRGTENALALRDSYVKGKIDIACPSLLPYEVLNALRYNPEFGQEQVLSALQSLEKFQLWLHPIVGEYAALCVKNSFGYGISLYDASYVALAEYLQAPLYTADKRLLEKLGSAKEEKVSSHHIASFKET
jgi:predicted nucleic acid-binding protein